jgi:hypothetical protein
MQNEFKIFDGFAFGGKYCFVMGLDGSNILVIGTFVDIIRREKQRQILLLDYFEGIIKKHGVVGFKVDDGAGFGNFAITV